MARAVIIGIALVAVAFGTLVIVSPLVRGLGFTRGALLGVVLVAAGSIRLFLEARELRRKGGR